MLNALITDPKTKISASVVNGEEENGVVVATRPLKTYVNALKFFTNDEYGADMNQDASVGGAAENVHDGGDHVYWTASNVVGTKVIFDSNDKNHTVVGGADSIKSDKAPVGEEFRFTKPAAGTIDCSAFVALVIWIYVDKDWKDGDSISCYGWDTATGLQVGDKVYLENYFNYSGTKIWQKVVIRLADFGSLSSYATLNALTFRQEAAEGKAPKYYLDDIEFASTGTPLEYCLEPKNGTWLHVNSFQIVIADAYTAKVTTDATMPSIPYNKFFGVTILGGINYRRIVNGDVINSATILNVLDIMSFSQAKISGYGSDGTNSWVSITVTFTEPVVLKAEDKDKLCFVLVDDLSGLLVFKVSAGCKIEQRK